MFKTEEQERVERYNWDEVESVEIQEGDGEVLINFDEPKAAQDCDQEKKLTHKEVKYEDPAQGHDRCGGCERFYPGEGGSGSYGCQVVQSPVAPSGWCQEFKVKSESVGDGLLEHLERGYKFGRKLAGAEDEGVESTRTEYENLDFQGLEINIENLRGSTRHGRTFHQKMTVPYGYIKGTEGMDGDAVDCFVGAVLDAPYVYVIHTKGGDPEDKVMLGFESAKAAYDCYIENYDEAGPKIFDGMDKLTMLEFKAKLRARAGKKITVDQAPTPPISVHVAPPAINLHPTFNISVEAKPGVRTGSAVRNPHTGAMEFVIKEQNG